MKNTVGKHSSPGSPMGCFLFIILLALAITLFVLVTLSSTYSPYEMKKPVATLEFKPSSAQMSTLILTPSTADATGDPSGQPIQIKGATWAIQGETLSWSKIISTLGLRSMYRLLAVQSIPAIESTQRHSLHQRLPGDEGQSWLYSIALQINKICHLARIKPISTANYPVQYGQIFSLYITPEGFKVIQTQLDTSAASASPSQKPQTTPSGRRVKYPVKEEDIKR